MHVCREYTITREREGGREGGRERGREGEGEGERENSYWFSMERIYP